MQHPIKRLRASLVALAALSIHTAGTAQCGLLSDPNSPSCKHGTGPITIAAPAAAQATRPGTAQPAQPGLSRGTSQGASDAPGMGQFACAFYDQRTNRCLTVRPNTQAYDNAVRAGIETAMGGMQIMQDGAYMAGQMGVTMPTLPHIIPVPPVAPWPPTIVAPEPVATGVPATGGSPANTPGIPPATQPQCHPAELERRATQARNQAELESVMMQLARCGAQR